MALKFVQIKMGLSKECENKKKYFDTSCQKAPLSLHQEIRDKPKTDGYECYI